MSGRSDTYHDNLSLFKDGVVGLGQLGGLLLLCVDHGLVQILGVDGLRHCVGLGEKCEVGGNLTSSTLGRMLSECGSWVGGWW